VRQGLWPRVLGVLAAGAIALAGHAGEQEALKEASATLAEADVATFLVRVSDLIDSGFGPGERESVARRIESMKVDNESVVEFVVKAGGRKIPLSVHIVIEPRETTTLQFFTSPELSDEIQLAAARYLDELEAGDARGKR